MTQRRPMLLLFAICVAAAFSVVPPPQAEAHTGDNPHVSPAVYQGKSGLNWNLDGDFGPNQVDEFKKAAANFNNRQNNVPVHRVRNCDNPGTCIQVHKVSQPCCSWDFRWVYRASSSDHLTFNMAEVSITQRRVCQAMWRMIGGHYHRERGCGTVTDNRWTKTLSDAEAVAINNNYCPACRLPAPEEIPAEEQESDNSPLPDSD